MISKQPKQTQCVDDSQAEVRDLAYSILALLVGFYGEAFIQDQLEGSDLDRIKLEKLLSTIHPGSSPSTPTKSHTLSGLNATSSPVTTTLIKSYSNTPSPSGKDKTPSGSRSKRINSLTRKSSGGLSGSPAHVSSSNTSQTAPSEKVAGDSPSSTTSNPYRTPSRSTKKSLTPSQFASSNTPQRSGDSHSGEKLSLIDSPLHNNLSSCNGDSDGFIDFDDSLDNSVEGDKVFAELTHSDDESLARSSTSKGTPPIRVLLNARKHLFFY